MIHRITQLFPLWAILFSIAAYFRPELFSPYKSAIIPFLTVVMFGMGMTLKWDHFKKVIQSPGIIFVGVGQL